MASQFLDKVGFAHFWAFLKNYLTKYDNKIEVLKVNGVEQPIVDKAVNLEDMGGTNVEIVTWTVDDIV